MGLNPQRKARLKRKAANKCALCTGDFTPSALTIDHIVPRHMGGSGEQHNTQVVCHPCHRLKTMLDNRRLAQMRMRVLGASA